MTMAHGICPTCQQEIRLTGLTPQRQVIAAHQFQGNKCEGSGSQSYEITRSSDMGSTKADAATWIPRVTTWIVVAAVCLLVLWLPVSCVARNISDGGRMDRAVAYICQSWVKAANEHTSAGSSSAPDSTDLDQSEIDKRVEAQCGYAKSSWENWWASLQTASPEPESTPSDLPSVNQAECERSLAAIVTMDIDEQSKADNIDSIRIDCNMEPLQDSSFWQNAWLIHQEQTGQTP